MALINRHPKLTDYFVGYPGLTVDTPLDEVPRIVRPYEFGRVIHFPSLKLRIDHDFWAAVPTEGYALLKKLVSSPAAGDPADDARLDRRLAQAQVARGLARDLKREVVRIYEQMLPIYERLFEGYRFTGRQAVWRLNTIRNENMHVDTYRHEVKDHFARVFINLDSQPRIWMTSYGIEQMFARFGRELSDEALRAGDPAAFRLALNTAAFGGRTTMWWDEAPRHVVYFDPGDVWAVDSRQVAHQIFYGRRAVSIDFFVQPDSMAKPKRHYLKMAESLRLRAVAERTAAAAQ